MTSRLKRKLNDLGVDPSSSKANESFCLVGYLVQLFTLFITLTSDIVLDWNTPSSVGEVERHR